MSCAWSRFCPAKPHLGIRHSGAPSHATRIPRPRSSRPCARHVNGPLGPGEVVRRLGRSRGKSPNANETASPLVVSSALEVALAPDKRSSLRCRNHKSRVPIVAGVVRRSTWKGLTGRYLWRQLSEFQPAASAFGIHKGSGLSIRPVHLILSGGMSMQRILTRSSSTVPRSQVNQQIERIRSTMQTFHSQSMPFPR